METPWMILNALFPFLFSGYPLISTLLFNRAIHQAALSDRWLPLLGMCVAVIVAVHALFSRPRSPGGNANARPKDASPSDAVSSPYTQGYRG